MERLTIELDDGRILDFGDPDDGPPATELRVVAEIPKAHFTASPDDRPICPICLSRGDLTDEHVPQTALGGRVMTRTCKLCNSDLGSRAESYLEHWFDRELMRVRFEQEDSSVRGRRPLPRIFVRESVADGSMVLWPDGPFTPEVDAIMSAGKWQTYYEVPDPGRVRAAVLKHAYLAACLHLRTIPDTPDAIAARTDLTAVRDTPKGHRLPTLSDVTSRVWFRRSPVGAQGPPLSLVSPPAEDGREPEVWVSLAGALFTPWPFSDLPPGTWIYDDGVASAGTSDDGVASAGTSDDDDAGSSPPSAP